jgi:hypothetical protein
VLLEIYGGGGGDHTLGKRVPICFHFERKPCPERFSLGQEALGRLFHFLEGKLCPEIYLLKGIMLPNIPSKIFQEIFLFFKISLFQEFPSWTGNPVPINPYHY